MDFKFALCFIFSFSNLFVTIQSIQPYEHLTNALSRKGYNAMAVTLGPIGQASVLLLKTRDLISARHNTTTLTLFWPQDQDFFNHKQPEPPSPTLLNYHIVPFKMDKHAMETSFGLHSKVDTLLHGHPLVVTSLPSRPAACGGYASLNQVKVTEWEVYNDGRLIVHGVEDFFDPAFEAHYDVSKNFPSPGVSDSRC